MNVRVRFFAGMRERLGTSETVDMCCRRGPMWKIFSPGSTPNIPALNLDQQRFTVTVNRAFARPTRFYAMGTRSR